MQDILGYMRKAITDYHMIEDGDTIAVGVSGGKGLRRSVSRPCPPATFHRDFIYSGSNHTGPWFWADTRKIIPPLQNSASNMESNMS